MTDPLTFFLLGMRNNVITFCRAKQYIGLLRGFVKLKTIQKSEKNSEVGGWVKPQFGFGKLDRAVGGCCLANSNFSRIFGFILT